MAENTTDAMNAETNEISPDKREKFDYDGFWKDLINRFCYLLLKRAVPELYENTDVTKEHRLLDTEFRDILNTGDPEIHTSPYYADLVLEIPLKNGGETWILLHVEAQQGHGGGNLAERMNHYRCLIYAHYRREPVALAIIAGAHRKDERLYAHSHFGTRTVCEYNNLVLADLDDSELQASDNPIDLVLYSAKCALKAKEELQKYTYLRTLTELLAERGWNSNEKRDLDNFIRRIINLTDEMLQDKYLEFRQQLNREGKLMYEPFLKQAEERMAERRGIEKGKEEGKEEVARKLLANGVSPDVVAKSTGFPVERVRTLVN